MSGGHFTAVLKVDEVRFVEAPAGATHSRSEPRPAPRRDVVEVAAVTIRADTLDALREKIAAVGGVLL